MSAEPKERVRYYVEVVRLAVDCMQDAMLKVADSAKDRLTTEERQRLVDCAMSDQGVADLRLDCILNALEVEPWPRDEAQHRLAACTWDGDPDL